MKVVGLSSAFLRGRLFSTGELVDSVLRAGAGALLLDDGLPGPLVDELLPLLRARRDELPVWGMENSCPATRRAAAQLCALDRAEADVAVEVAAGTVDLAGDGFGEGTVVLLRLGEVAAARDRWPSVRRAYLRDELGDDPALLEALQKERAAHAHRHLDALRRSLDRLARRAEQRGVRLGLRNPARLSGLPSPVEMGILLEEFAGGPVVPALDLPAAHLVERMGGGPLAATVEAFGAAPLVLAADACGPVAGLPPGQGELDVAAALKPLSAARWVFAASPLLHAREVAEGVRRLAATAG